MGSGSGLKSLGPAGSLGTGRASGSCRGPQPAPTGWGGPAGRKPYYGPRRQRGGLKGVSPTRAPQPTTPCTEQGAGLCLPSHLSLSHCFFRFRTGSRRGVGSASSRRPFPWPGRQSPSLPQVSGFGAGQGRFPVSGSHPTRPEGAFPFFRPRRKTRF